MVLYSCVLIVFLLHRESLKLILVDEPLPEVVLSHIPTFNDSYLRSNSANAGIYFSNLSFKTGLIVCIRYISLAYNHSFSKR
jgi:hypothetical protein